MTGPPAHPGEPAPAAFRPRSDAPFTAALWGLLGLYALLIAAMLGADAWFILVQPGEGGAAPGLRAFRDALESPDIRYAIRLTFISCTVTAALSTVAAVAIGYVLSRVRFPGRALVDVIFDIPIVLPPLVIGLSLLILFSATWPGSAIDAAVGDAVAFLNRRAGWLTRLLGSDGIRGVTYEIPAVILAQFSVACAFAVRTMRVTFDQIDRRREDVALTLGCSRGQAFWRVTLPEARRGVVTAFTLSWARALGEFGPILVFAGSTRGRTEVLPTTVFLELQIGNIEAAVAISLLMVTAAAAVLLIARRFGDGLSV